MPCTGSFHSSGLLLENAEGNRMASKQSRIIEQDSSSERKEGMLLAHSFNTHTIYSRH
jgi:hypothetical protein